MARYQIGDVVAVVNRYELVGRVVGIDKEKGYKVDRGKDVVYLYENQIAPINLSTPTKSQEVVSKLDKAGKQVQGFADIRQLIIDFLSNNTKFAEAFADYVVKVSTDALIAFLKAIKESGLTPTINIQFAFVINN